MVVLTVLIIGMVAWPRLPIQFLMDMDIPVLSIYIPYPEATPEQVENEVALPVEGALKTISGVRRISCNASQGGCSLWMRFSWDTNMAVANAELRDRLERVRLKLPREIEHIFIHRYDQERIPVLEFALFRAERQDELALFARKQLRRQLMRVEGVADIEISGQEVESIFVDFDQNALSSLELNIYDVVAAINTATIDLGIGQVLDAHTVCFVRLRNEFDNTVDLENVIISRRGIRLKDVAKIDVRVPPGADTFTIDGKRGIIARVIKEGDANAVATCDAVRAEIDRLRSHPEFSDVEVFVFSDQSEIIRFALDSLYLAGQYGSVLACVVLWLFLRRLRATLLVALAIPASMVTALVFLYFAGQSLNLVTIGALLISVGMLVDNAIVVIENIHRHHALSSDYAENARRGAAEVGLAVTASTTTTVVVFIPVFYMESGELARVMREFAGPISVSLFASLALALTVIPLAESHIRPSQHELWKWMKNQLPRPRFQPLGHLRGFYAGFIRRAVVGRHLVLGGILLLLALTYWVPYRQTGFRQFPEMDMREVGVEFRADTNFGEENAKAAMEQLAARIEVHRERLGIRNLYMYSGGWGGYLRAYLVKPKDLPPGAALPFSTEEVRQELSRILPYRVPGGTVDCGVMHATPEEGQRVTVKLQGDDRETLGRLSEELMRRMAALPELADVKSSKPQDRDEIQLVVDKTRAASFGATPMSVARTVNFALGGASLPYMIKDGQEIAVRGQYAWTDRGDKGDLEAMRVQGPGGALVSLTQLADMHKGDTPPGISRSNGKSYLDVYGRATDRDVLPVRDKLRGMLAQFDLPPGYSAELDENLQRIDETMENFRRTLTMALILIYFVMAALFESWLLPLSIITTVPMAFVGVYWSMYLTNTQMDTISLVGSILMCGIIVNNGIVIVDHINLLRQQGLSRIDAVVQGSCNRLRPVLMTTLTTVFGILPIAVGNSAAGGILDSLGRALVGGICAGSLLTLFVVPLTYTVIDDLRLWFRAYFAALRSLT
jgi:HAE1 family hydrophobic/amphiphilic exporter-1